ncbi:GMP synthase [glutamine-hydrolyzing] subunit B [Candidatus Burarchaeum australiense]|nr:GMP synthase [glutamine-hydrolyzing] subunit B [Candidatus Burarchaeum australiense]
MFDAAKFIEASLPKLRAQVGDNQALVALSGGVDSSVAAALMNKAVGKQLRALLLDTGFMRENEPEQVRKWMKQAGIELDVRDVSKEFFSALKGLSDAEEKRKAFRNTFYTVFGRETKKFNCDYLVQGTIAPDWIETEGGIKSQHNVLEQIGIDTKTKFGFRLIEPLSQLYKDQVRLLGKELGLPQEVCERQPFPGPGLMVRCVGEVREDKVKDLRHSVAVVEKHVTNADAQQYFAAIFDSRGKDAMNIAEQASELFDDKCSAFLYDSKATGVKGDLRFYGKLVGLKLGRRHPVEELSKKQLDIVIKNEGVCRVLVKVASQQKKEPYCVAIRAIRTRDFMTATVSDISWDRLDAMAKEILASCPRVWRVYYDVTPKPPATVEFE